MALNHLVLFVILAICTQCQSKTLFNYTILEDTAHYVELVREQLGHSLECEGDTANKFKNYLSKKWEPTSDDWQWIGPMIDSMPLFEIIPSGLSTGNVVSFGQYDECMSIGTDQTPNNAGVKGQYCSYALSINIEGLKLTKSICIPDNCKVHTTSFTITTSPNVTIGFFEKYCQTKSTYKQLTWDDWTVIGVLSAILAIIAISTIYDLYLHYTEKKAHSPLQIAFSLITNSKKLFATSNAPGQIYCLHGIRSISLMWIIAGHRFVSISWIPTVNFLQMNEFQTGYQSTYITSARAAVDTFFLFSAFLVAYIYFKGLKKSISQAEAKGTRAHNTLTVSKIPLYYFHRCFRILPALTAVFFVYITVFRRIGGGPVWPISLGGIDNCKNWWWSYFLFVQNYVNYKDMCIVPTWYISADMQLFLLSPLLIIPMGELIARGKKKLAYIAMAVVVFMSIVVPMTVEFFREFDKDKLLYETHHRASVYTIGFLFGMIVVDCTGKKIRINHFVNVLLWVLSLGAMLAIVLTMHYTEGTLATLVKNNLFFSLTRPVWSAAICWIVFSCHFGYGGCVNWLLSIPLFQVNTKLSFSMYLLHNLLNTVSSGNTKYTRYFSEYLVMYEWCGDFIMTILLSIVWVLCFESPIVSIEKVIFRRGEGEKPSPPVEQKTEAQLA